MSDLNELMTRDPLLLTREDIRTIIASYRDMRHKFNLGDMRAGSIKPRASKKEDEETAGLDLEIKL